MNLRLSINTETNELVGISKDCKEVSLDPKLLQAPEGLEDELQELRECVISLTTQIQEILDKSPWLACEEPLNIDCES